MIHGHTIALSSTVKFDLSVGICENGYPFTHIPTYK